jgi:predicted TIM-barrel fold metal-dependent hydrolase
MRLSPPLSSASERRHVLCCSAAAVGGLFTSLLDAAQAAPRAKLPNAAGELVDQALAGLDGAQLWDVHAHLLGTGDAGSGCWVHPHLDSGWHPLEALRKHVILRGAGVDARSSRIDHDYVQRLAWLADDFPRGARWLLFAFEHAHDDRGVVQPGHTTFHVPDAWAAHVAQQHAERFGWVASIHPYRSDALERLDRALAQGALAVKWLPSAMNIDLRDVRCMPFYQRLQCARVPLIVHVGEEKAVPGAGRDDLGNPLLLRLPLRHGVRVIAAHCASLGSALDIDQRVPTRRPAFELFARLMDEPDWHANLMGDVSALFQVNRSASSWRTVLTREDWHARLLHGSDYPLPCIRVLVQLGPLVRAGVLDEVDVAALEALRAHNPLLFDLVLKRRVRWRGARLSDAVFQTRRHFRLPAG